MLARVQHCLAIGRPARRRDDEVAAVELLERTAGDVDHLERKHSAMRAMRHGDRAAIGRPARLAPCLVGGGTAQHAILIGSRVEQQQAASRGSELHGHDGAVGARVGLDEPKAVRQATLHTVSLDVQVGTHLAGRHEVRLRKQQPALIRHAGPECIAPADAPPSAVERQRILGDGRTSVGSGVNER